MRQKKRVRPPRYYLPHQSYWPIVGSVSLFLIAIGFINVIHDNTIGWFCFTAGALGLMIMLFGWFRSVIDENNFNYHSELVNHSFRWGMIWFIFSEVMFFGAFFGVLFYVRLVIIPELGGLAFGPMTHELLWPKFQAHWPLLINPDPTLFPGPKAIMPVFGIPLLNTFLLLSSAVTLTWAHWQLLNNHRRQVIIGLMVTIALGLSFLSFQIHEYLLAFEHYGLTLASGIYGTTFFILTGFHGAHVTLGLIMLSIILIRLFRGDFDTKHHFGFEACAWYWHFVDVVWLFLFVFVYWL